MNFFCVLILFLSAFKFSKFLFFSFLLIIICFSTSYPEGSIFFVPIFCSNFFCSLEEATYAKTTLTSWSCVKQKNSCKRRQEKSNDETFKIIFQWHSDLVIGCEKKIPRIFFDKYLFLVEMYAKFHKKFYRLKRALNILVSKLCNFHE